MSKKDVRREFRNAVFARDLWMCRFCHLEGIIGELDAHHITDRNEMPNGGYALSNGISLCRDCHYKAEQFHISGNKEAYPGMHPDNLYSIINSSYEQAFKDSEKL